MKPKSFAVLAGVAALSLVAAVATYSASAPWSGSSAANQKLFAHLASAAGRIARIEIRQGPATLTLERAGEQWSITERNGFPAAADKVRALLVGLTEAELVEPKTRNPARYALLDLGDQEASGGGKLVRLLDGTGEVLGEVVVGKSRRDAFGSGKAGTYVRRPADAQTWLASTEINSGVGLRDWAKTRLFETQTEKIKRISIERASEPAYQIEREQGGTSHKLADIPAGKKLKYVNAIDNIVEALASIEFEDVRKAEAAPDAGAASLETDSGLKVEIKIRRDKDDAWLALSATGAGEAEKSAGELAARAGGWEFKIPPSKADAILKKKDELLEDGSS